MSGSHTFRKVDTMADDAITVRIKRTDDGYVGILDFPSFQKRDGTIQKASSFSGLPAHEALVRAVRIQPLTPFDEVVVKLDEDVDWQLAWGKLAQ